MPVVFKTVVLSVISAISLTASIFYLVKKKVFLQPVTRNLTNGYNKIKFRTSTHKNHIYNWDGSECLYCETHIMSTKTGVYNDTVFKEPNSFYALINNKKHLISSKEIHFNLNLNLKKAIKISLRDLKRIIEQKGDKEIYKEYYKNRKFSEKESKANIKFLEATLEENKEYYLLARFDDGEIDFQRPAYISDRETFFNKSIYITALFIASPGIMITFLIIFSTL